jgi:hypothetical protein
MFGGFISVYGRDGLPFAYRIHDVSCSTPDKFVGGLEPWANSKLVRDFLQFLMA